MKLGVRGAAAHRAHCRACRSVSNRYRACGGRLSLSPAEVHILDTAWARLTTRPRSVVQI